jgi:alpha-glucuronidase
LQKGLNFLIFAGMKKINIISFALLLISGLYACSSKDKASDKTGYIELYDTTYRKNSLEIESITRTFYQSNSVLNQFTNISKNKDRVALTNQIGEKEIVLLITNRDADFKIGVFRLSKEELLKVFEDVDIIINNQDKRLKFDIIADGIVSGGTLETSYKENSVTINRNAIIHLNKEQISEMKAAFESFLNESKS